MNKRILSILVENTAGVLSRVSGLFSRRGYNIDSLSAGITTDPNYTRMTVVCKGDELILEQITRQVEKLEDVLSVKVLKDDQSVTRELMLVKVRVSPEQRAGITAIVDIFRANIIDVGKESMIVELTGNKSKLEAFIDLLDGRMTFSTFQRMKKSSKFVNPNNILLHKQEEDTDGSKNLLSGRL